jgi:UDP-GlcNAc:undecaprenyl-phosphate GlcNAc-1-phosphate transferase
MIRLGQWFCAADVPGGRRQHQGTISRLGGVALFGGFMVAGLLVFILKRNMIGDSDNWLLTGVMVGAIFVFIFGLIDDFLELPAWPQFAAQFITALIAIAFTIFIEEVTLPFVGFTRFPWYITYPLTIFWVMAMINTVNFLDGLDGLAAGVAAIAALLFAWHAYTLGQETVYLFPLALAGTSIGFLLFNFSPAKIFMGSVGGVGAGFPQYSGPGQGRYGLAGFGNSNSGCCLVICLALGQAGVTLYFRAGSFALSATGSRLQSTSYCSRLLCFLLDFWLVGAVHCLANL